MNVVTNTATLAPSPDRDDWIDFLHWFYDQGATVRDVIYCVEKPHKHADAYARYLAAGGPDR